VIDSMLRPLLICLIAVVSLTSCQREAIREQRTSPPTIHPVSVHVGLRAVDSRRYFGWNGLCLPCAINATRYAQFAKDLGFSGNVLLSPTVEQFYAAIRTAATATPAAGTFLLTYNGHGSEVPDVRYTTAPLAYGYTATDQTFTLVDREVLDKELLNLWTTFQPNVTIIFIADSCHSGGIAKLSPDTRGGQLKFLDTPVQDQIINAYGRDYAKIQQALPLINPHTIKQNVILLAACEASELAIYEPARMSFTDHFFTVWNSDRHAPTLQALLHNVRTDLLKVNTKQHAFYDDFGSNIAVVRQRPPFQH